MIASIKVTTENNCKIYIEDTSEYSQSSNETHEFSYSDTVSIDILKHNKLQETVYKNAVISNHSNTEKVQIPIDMDGWFSIVHIILPSKEWFDTQLNKTEGSRLWFYDVVYYSDGSRIYKYVPGITETSQEVLLEEILNLNLKARDYTVYRIEEDYVSICFLQKCYINLCQQIFSSRGISPCWNKNAVDSELIYKRDLVWMAINVITYLTELHSECNPTLYEVERIIENINGCNGLCQSGELYKKSNSGCGCSK